MKKTALLAALAVGASFAYADAAKSSYSITVDFPYTSKYIFRGQEVTTGNAKGKGSDAIQPSIELTTGDFYAGVWTNQPVTKNNDNEFDIYGGYKQKLNDMVNVDAGATIYYYPELNASAKSDRATTEGFVGINANVKGITAGVYGYYDFDLKNTTIQGQLGYSLPLPEKGLSLDLSTHVGRVFNNDNGDYTYWSFGANVPYKLNDSSTVYAGVTYTNNNLKFATGDFITYTVGLTVGF